MTTKVKLIAPGAVTTDSLDFGSFSTTDISEGTNLYYTDARVQTKIDEVIDSAPGALDTLNELAAALGDDPNFATTVTNNLATKAPLADPSFTGTVDVTGTITADGITSDLTGNVTGNVTGDLTGELDLSAISSTINDTAVDVFVYDTRKDSDGGAWRKRTQHTSWYNETLNTATRGSRREFPAVAILVHTGSTIKIYDGDDPSMPLWGHYSNLTQDSGFAASVTARDGSIFGSQRATSEVYSGNGWYRLNFVADYFFSNIITVFAGWRQGRHDNLLTTNTYTLLGDRTTPLYVSNLAVNDLAVTVLPNAPIDTATGLPIPTIALATDGGVSIIKDDGSVIDSVETSAYSNIDISIDYRLISGRSDTTRFFISEPLNTLAEGFQPYGYRYTLDSTVDYPTLLPNDISNNFGRASVDTYVRGGSKVLTLWNIKEEDVADNVAQTESLMSFISSDFNTGWMHGDIKLAALSDTDATNVTGTELITNGTFDSSTGWTLSQGATISSGVLNLPADGTSGTAKYDTQILEAGKTYVLEYDITASTANYGVRWFYTNSGNTGTYFFTNYTKALGTHTATFTPDFDCWIGVSRVSVHTGSVSVDNISVRLAEQDRSVNNNGLQTFGTVTKTPVATGADLVAYSGFSGTNYLLQPNNSGLDIGTEDFSVMYWVNVSDLSGTQIYWSIANPIVNNNRTAVYTLSNGDTRFFLRQNSTEDIYGTGAGGLVTNKWTHIAAVRSGNTLLLYIDGELKASGATTKSIAQTDKELKIGVDWDVTSANASGSSMALFRYSLTAPTAEQIKKMYNDEKVLFQENAKATLYGTSDAVTALAYDEDTNILHVGTSQGRSDFQGLRRINNTTDAVGAAISASNGMIVEE